ncbi:TolC family protein [Marinigracilibium pacificum]|uniref:TolC family protein n=1 Tax=Marinigracilibium pacificum TaxID=2729599 RepID=A0A848IRZ4_9BACT|nr:TolC family protein [Marinigracilibium pacificum]NMM47233.1 TolC family protein [Marinigracilibium pacificum]
MKQNLLIIFIFGAFAMNAQNVDYDKIILPEEASGLSFEEKLVRLAWLNYPLNRVRENNVEVAKKDIHLAQWDWLDNVEAQGNLNEFNIDPDPGEGNQFFPRYNFRLTLKLGDLVNTPAEVKRAKAIYRNSLEEVNAQKLTIRKEVLQRYENFKLYDELLKINTVAMEDADAEAKLLEEKFKNGGATLNEYNTALRVYNTEKIKRMTTERDREISKLEVEELIGMKLEEVN